MPLVVLLVAVTACAPPSPPRSRTFVGATAGARLGDEAPTGLNPLGGLRACPGVRPPDWAQAAPLVLISRPDFFSRQASEMILHLHEALAENPEGLAPMEMVVSRAPLQDEASALGEGRHCGALVVLWERPRSQTLELTLPTPARIPLRGLVHRKLCEFGDHAEQATLLYLTILGLTATAQNDFGRANYFLTAAADLDARCLHLPPGLKRRPGQAGQARNESLGFFDVSRNVGDFDSPGPLFRRWAG